MALELRRGMGPENLDFQGPPFPMVLETDQNHFVPTREKENRRNKKKIISPCTYSGKKYFGRGFLRTTLKLGANLDVRQAR